MSNRKIANRLALVTVPALAGGIVGVVIAHKTEPGILAAMAMAVGGVMLGSAIGIALHYRAGPLAESPET